MPILYRASFGYLRRHPWQLFLALIGICIGVAVMVAIDLASESSRKAFFMSMDSINGEATHQIVGGPGGIDEELYRQLRVENGIRSVAPVVSGYLQIDGASFQLLGVDVFAEREFRAYASTGSMTENLVGTDASDRSNANGAMSAIRRLLTNSGVLLLTSRTAATLGLAVNDQFPITVDGHEYMATLGGTLDADNGIGLDNVVIGDIGFVQGWLGMQAKLSRIDVRMSDAAVLTRISELLPPGVSLLSAEGRTQSTAAMSEAFTTNLFAMSLLALLVGVFLIYNSVSFAVLQRRELIGVFRALGVSRGQVFRLVMAEAFILGLVGAVLGLWVGVLLGEQLVVLVSRTINDHYFASNVVDVSLPASTLTKGLLAGVCATLLAASIPAIEASAVRPRLALMRSVIEMRAQRSLPILAIAGAALIVISLLLLMTSGEDLAIGLIAVFAIILGYAFCIPLAVAWCSKLLVGFANRYAGTTARMTAGNLGASLSRTGVAIVSLAIAVSATIGVGVMVNSFRISVGDWLESTLQSDIYVGVPRGNLDQALIPDLISVAGVREFSTARRNWLESEGGRIGIFAVKPAPDSSPGLSIRSDDPTAVWQQLEGDKTVLVSDPYAYKQKVAVGDEITLQTDSGSQVFRIAGVYQSYDSNAGVVMMFRTNYDRYFDDPKVDSIGLYLDGGVNPEVVMNELRAVSDGRQSLVMNSNARIRELSLGVFDRTFVVTDVLYWLAVFVAVVGILGAMLALQLERVREFGILRAVGMTPLQVGKLVTAQSVLFGFLSGLAAIPLGLVMAALLIEVINRRAFGWQMEMSIAASGLLAAMLLAIGASLIAGIYPAYTAARTKPALAMREE